MNRWTPLLLMLVATSLSLSCSHGSNGALSTDESGKSTGQRDMVGELTYTVGVIDTVKVRKDPKGGWFGRKLRDVYMQGEDTPVLYCDAGPSFPTGKQVTIYYQEVMSKPDSTACKAAVTVLDGEGTLEHGKPVTLAELARMREQEEHFIRWVGLDADRNMELGWRNPKPIGDPCPDVSGHHSPYDIAQLYKGQNCSVVFVYNTGYILFVNWKVVGRINQMGPELARDVVQTIIDVRII